jgi:hypothetical protein
MAKSNSKDKTFIDICQGRYIYRVYLTKSMLCNMLRITNYIIDKTYLQYLQNVYLFD